MNYSKARILWSHRPEKTSVLETCSDPHKAIALLTDAIMLDAKYADAYMRRGLAKSELGRMDDAYEDATAALRLQPTAENYAYRAMVFLRAKKFTAAQKDLNVSFRGNEEQHLAWTVQGSLHLATNATSAACEDFEKACSYGNCMPLEYLQKDDLCK